MWPGEVSIKILPTKEMAPDGFFLSSFFVCPFGGVDGGRVGGNVWISWIFTTLTNIPEISVA